MTRHGRLVSRRAWLRRWAVRGAVAGTAAAAACAPEAGETPRAGPPGPPAQPAALRFTYWGADPEEVQVQNTVIAAFATKQPQIKVENSGDAAASGPYHEKLIVQAAADTAPDVARINSQNMPRFAKGGLLRALDPLVQRDRYRLDDFWTAVLPLNQYQQKLQTLPVIGGPNPMFWNKRLYREAGIPPATELDAKGQWTWDRFAELARQLAKREGDTFRVSGFTINLDWGGIGPFVWSAGGDYFNAGRTKCTLAEAPAIEAVQYMADLLNKHLVGPRPGEPATGLDWQGGTIATQISAITGSYQWRRDPTFEFDVVLNPKGRGGQIGLLNANGYGVLAGSKAADAAWEFLKHLASVETLAYLASIGRSFPWRKSIAQSREYRDNQPIASVDVLFKLADKHGRVWPVVPTWTDMQAFANPRLQQVAQGKLAVRDALIQIAAEVDRLLAA